MPPTPDPFAALEEAASRQAAGERAARALSAARARLVLGRDAKSVFFATLALKLTPTVDWKCPTMATDGRVLEYNPDFVGSLSPDELLGVVAHEALHCALAHHARRGNRDAPRWNEACDLAINALLEDAGFSLPECRLMPGEGRYAGLARGLSAEAYFAAFPAENNRPDSGGGDPGGCGSVKDPGKASPAELADQEAEWAAAAAQAENSARGRGELPGGLARGVGAALRPPPADWRSVLREFVSSTARNDYSWSRPNRRFVARGLFLPGLRSEELGEVVVAVDCSGSVNATQLAVFASELDALLSAFDCTATLVYHDSVISHVQAWQPSDGPLVLEPRGGGGTSHVPVFEWLEKSGRAPACLVCLTDMETRFPTHPPAAPVLWAVVGGRRPEPPFGRAIYLA